MTLIIIINTPTPLKDKYITTTLIQGVITNKLIKNPIDDWMLRGPDNNNLQFVKKSIILMNMKVLA